MSLPFRIKRWRFKGESLKRLLFLGMLWFFFSSFSYFVFSAIFLGNDLPASALLRAKDAIPKTQMSFWVSSDSSRLQNQSTLIFSSLDLRLLGTFYNVSNPSKSKAVLRSSKDSLLVVQVGEIFYGALSLLSVGRLDAVVKESGMLYQLSIKREGAMLISGAGAHKASYHAPTRKLSSAQGKIVDKILKNPVEIFRYLSVSPVRENGKIVSVRLSSLKQEALSLGFKENDVLTAANGASVESLSSNPSLLQKIKNSKSITFEVKRKGLAVKVALSRP